MKKNFGSMNIPLMKIYNEEDDVYYVTFKTGEPSYCVEVDVFCFWKLVFILISRQDFVFLILQRIKSKQLE